MNEKELYKVACKVADMAFEYLSDDRENIRWLEDRRNESVNPFYNQTESGLFIEVYYGIPGDLWTPWGKWNCWGSGMGHWDYAMSQFLSRLGVIEYQALKETSNGVYGPVYAITHVEGIPLPPAIVRKYDQYLKYEDARTAWEILKQK